MKLSKRWGGMILTTLLATSAAAAGGYSRAKDRILLSSVQSLTVRPGQLTTGRRVEPIPQVHPPHIPSLLPNFLLPRLSPMGLR